MIPSAFELSVTEKIRNAGKSTYPFWRAIAVYGIPFYIVAAVLFSYAGWFHAGLSFLVLIIGSYIAVNLFQRMIRRDRPDFEKLTKYKMWWKSYSLPSGHAMGSAVGATFLLMATQFSSLNAAYAWGAVLIILAILIGISRIVVGVHYLYDVLAGFLLGTILALGYSLLVL
jgi:membrane-associated phospholipid phosphatase